jgi:hypothetical protein
MVTAAAYCNFGLKPDTSRNPAYINGILSNNLDKSDHK